MTSFPFPPVALKRAVAATAAVMALGLWFAFGSLPYAQVNITWSPDASRAAREYVAAKRSLRFIREDDPGVWVYLLNDTSKANIGGILSTPGVQRVRFLDPKTFTVEYQRAAPADWLDKHGYFPRFNFRARMRAVGIAPMAILCLFVSLLTVPEGRAWLLARIPRVSPAAMGVFRVVLAVALLPLVLHTVPPSMPLLRAGCLVCLAGFGAGIFARLSLGVFTVLFVIAHRGEIQNHDFALPTRTLALLMLVPWGAGFSVDETVRRLSGRWTPPIAARRYGLAVWIPMFMLGSAYMAAAYAKLDQDGRAWLFGGAARYFFVIDGPGAPGHLGTTVAANDALSVVLSAGGVLTEASIIFASIWAIPIVQVLAGTGALLLHLGFWYLQGHWWFGWWALLPAFFPWHAAVSRAQQALPVLELDTDEACASCRRRARVVRALDWLDRTSVVRGSGSAVDSPATPHRAHHPLCVRRPDTRSAECGLGAYGRLARVLPLAWPLLPALIPLLWVAGRRRSTDGAAGPDTRQRVPEAIVDPRAGDPFTITRLSAVVLCLMVIQQPILSFLVIELPPVLSNYPMYAHVNWDSKAQFAADMDRQFQPRRPAIRFVPRPGLAPAVLSSRLQNLGAIELVTEVAARAATGETIDEDQIVMVRGLSVRYQQSFGEPLPVLDVFTAKWRFDWSVATFVPSSDWSRRATLDLNELSGVGDHVAAR